MVYAGYMMHIVRKFWIQARWPLAEALSNQPISDSVTFKDGIVQYRLGKVVSAWRMNAISKWRYSLYGRGINIASVTSHEYP
jgi:hypothetical protein